MPAPTKFVTSDETRLFATALFRSVSRAAFRRIGVEPSRAKSLDGRTLFRGEIRATSNRFADRIAVGPNRARRSALVARCSIYLMRLPSSRPAFASAALIFSSNASSAQSRRTTRVQSDFVSFST